MVDKEELVAKIHQWGASIVHAADTARLSGIDTEPADLLDGFPRAVSNAVRLSDAVMDLIDRQPTPLYSSHYATRAEAVDLEKCIYQVRDVFGEIPQVTSYICGICIKVCPWGNKAKQALPSREI
jgi:epoxyqueuosine reductase QueG